MNRQYKSEAMEPIYEEALANFEVGAITRAELEAYEQACFVSEDSTAPWFKGNQELSGLMDPAEKQAMGNSV